MEEAKERMEAWLRTELERADVDADVYVPYVADFLEAGGVFDAEGAAEVLAAVMDEDAATALAQRAAAQWRTEAAAADEETRAAANGDDDEGSCLAAEVCAQLRLAEAEAAAQEQTRKPEAEGVVADSAERARLVARYGAVVTEAESDSGAAGAGAQGRKGRGGAAAAGAEEREAVGSHANRGVAAAAAERQRAEMKAAHDAKLEQERRSREKQRLTREEKKAQRRAACQKGERRR